MQVWAVRGGGGPGSSPKCIAGFNCTVNIHIGPSFDRVFFKKSLISDRLQNPDHAKLIFSTDHMKKKKINHAQGKTTNQGKKAM